MKERSTLERNLLALSASDPELCSRLSAAKPSQRILFLSSSQGCSIPALLTEDSGPNRAAPFHSTMDPIREGNRYLNLFSGAGYLVFLGLGGAYHIAPFLQAEGVNRLLIIDANIEILRGVLEKIDLRSLLLDPRVRLKIGTPTEALRDFLLSDYVPAIDGDLRTVPLRPALEVERSYYEGVLSAIEKVIGQIADDYTVQTQFGKKWFINTLANLAAAEESTISIKPVHKAIVVGAGPSLEQQIHRLPSLRKGSFLIASDTSLPALLQYGIKPDLILSIDCQQVSYQHFMQAIPQDIPLVLDLASPPILTRLTPKTIFFSSGHPFSQYVNTHWRRFPFIDTSGGNVSHAAVSLARFLGAQEIYLLGTDFSFPEGKSYCRGTYVYPFFRSLESRTRPLEGLLYAFMLSSSSITKEQAHGSWRYTTLPMMGYKERLENYLRETGGSVIPLPGKGLPLRLPQGNGKPSGNSGETRGRVIGNILAAGAPSSNWRLFLQGYLSEIEALPEPYHPLRSYFNKLPEEQRKLWITQYPVAAVIRRHPQTAHLKGPLILEKVRAWTISVIRRHLER